MGRNRRNDVLTRWAIRIVSSLVGIAVGLTASWLILPGFHLSITGLVEATVVFWVVHLAMQFVALRMLIREPSIAMAGLLAVASTIVSLIVVSLIVAGLSIRGISTYVFATLIIWATTAVADMTGRHMIRSRRLERRDN
jgi:hypothetical protein